uniref:Secreted protein n=1 Tax=Cyclopterus lumpus TaxID=8103 RepID=A0A8C3A0D6_CYCLU
MCHLSLMPLRVLQLFFSWIQESFLCCPCLFIHTHPHTHAHKVHTRAHACSRVRVHAHPPSHSPLHVSPIPQNTGRGVLIDRPCDAASPRAVARSTESGSAGGCCAATDLGRVCTSRLRGI